MRYSTLDYNDTYEPEKNANKFGMKVNPKAYNVASVLEKLGNNQVKYGAPYCPCLPKAAEASPPREER